MTFYWKRAGAAEQIGRPEQALADLRTAYGQTTNTRVTGTRRDVVRELANAESAAGNFETAIELMQQAIREVPKSIGNYETLAGSKYVASRRDVLAHVMNHSTYHRGQVALAIREDGGEPLQTDYILFVRETSAGV